MESYGSYEAQREIGSAYGSTVFSARKAGEATDRFVIKVYDLKALVGDNAENRSDLEPLLQDLALALANRIDLQKKAAEASAHIEPILERGHDERGVWYVTYLYPHSLQRIIAGKVALTQENLHHILRSMVRGALDLKKVTGRPHGNLKPSNVLISGAGRMRAAAVVLSDPLPGRTDESANYERSDLRVIGEILLQLVQRRRFTESRSLMLPIESSPEWTQLFGKASSQWLDLCNWLLEPSSAPTPFGLEAAEKELEALEPKPLVTRRAVALAGGAALFAVIGLLIFSHFRNQGTVILTSDPPGAAFYLKEQDKYKELGKTKYEGRWPKGVYEVEARWGSSTQLFVTTLEGRGTSQTNFVFDYGGVSFTSEPEGAFISLDGKDVLADNGKPAQTPFTMQYLEAAKTLKYAIRLEGYVPKEDLLLVPSARGTKVVNEKLVRIDPGNVEVSFVFRLPRDSKVRLQWDSQTNTYTAGTLANTQMKIGVTNRVTATYLSDIFPNWPPQTRDVVVVKGRNEVEFNFDYDRLILREIDPIGASYKINGKDFGVFKGDEITYPVLRGNPVRIQIDKENYDPWEFTANFSQTNLISLSPRLKARTGLAAITCDSPMPPKITIRGPNKFEVTFTSQLTNVALAPGSYTATAELPPLTPVLAEFSIQSRQTQPVPFRFAYCTVYLYSNLRGTEVQDPSSPSRWLPLEIARPLKMLFAPGPIKLVARDPKPAPGPGLTNEILERVLTGGQVLTNVFEFKYGTFSAESVPTAGVSLAIGGWILPVPTTNYIRAGEVEYKIYFQTNGPDKSLGERVFVKPGSHYVWFKDLTQPEIKSYVNGIGMILMAVKPDYYVGQWEVSLHDYTNVTGKTLSGRSNYPITQVSFVDATNFCRRLTERDQSDLALHSRAGWQYELPNEVQWRQFAEPTLEILQHSIFNSQAIQPIGSTNRPANRYGIYDLFGNVAEWCWSSNHEVITLGGHNSKRTPSLNALYDRTMRVSANDIGLDAIFNNGSSATGFRVILRPRQSLF